MKASKLRTILSGILVSCMLLQPFSAIPAAQAEETEGVVIDAAAYGADPTGAQDSTRAIQQAFAAAKEASDAGASSVTVRFPQGEYHIYKDYAAKREYHTSNTNSIENPEKTIGILIEDQENFTLDGNGSLFVMHGNMMALAVVRSRNVKLENFSWDFGVPTVTEMTVTGMGTEDGKDYTDFLIPECFPHEVSGNTIKWYSEKSPYTNQYYWTQTGVHSPTYAVVGHQPDGEMSRNYYTSGNGADNGNPFVGVSSVQELDETHVRVKYTSRRPAMQQMGTVLELAANAHRQTAGAFTWESENVVADHVNVHFMHGFGWLVQMSKDVFYYNCNLTPRENSGHRTVSFADGIHASGAAGKLVIENCNFSDTHDDPINLHGTFTRVEQRVDDHTLVLKYIHNQQGGFPQYHVGDKVAFFTRDTLESTDHETLYTVSQVISNPGESGNDLRTMRIRFEETLPSNLSDKVSNQPKYVAENVTYAPEVTIRGCTFRNVPTRGILCTTRNPVLIEDNTFYNMSMATIFLSNDSNDWYESGPIRDMTIRGNEFYIKSIGRTAWEYAPAVWVHPVTKGGGLPSEDNPIHKNITIEENVFHMDVDTVVKAESVENLTIRNNTILRTNPNISLAISTPKTTLVKGDRQTLQTTANGDQHVRDQDNVYEFTKCKNVVLEGNTYDDGLKRYAVLSNMSDSNLTNKDEEIKVVRDRSQPAADPVENIRYISSDPEVLSVSPEGRMLAKKAGTASVYACYDWNGEVILSNEVTMTVEDEAAPEDVVTMQEEEIILTEAEATHTMHAETASGKAITWEVEDFVTGGATDAAVISANGVLTAKKNGIVWVKASCGLSTVRKAVVISLADTGEKNREFSIVREDKTNYTLEKEKIEIDLQSGDLYQENNNVKNLFLYPVPETISKNNLRTVIKVENMPVKEAQQWDTASFLLYKDDNNYISSGKKSHFNGIVTVSETNGSATETGGNEAQNTLTTAYLGFYKNGNTVSVDFKTEDGTWTKVRDLSCGMLGDDFKIGFTGWESNNRGKKVTFSEFRVGSGDMSYEALCAQPAISFVEEGNQAPTAANAAFDKAEYVDGEKAVVTYDYADADGDAEGRTLYCFTYDNGICEVTTKPELLLEYTGKVVCDVYPVDEKGRPGEKAGTAEVVVKTSSRTLLQKEVEEAGKLDLSGYTEETAAKYREALAQAQNILSDAAADQNAARQALEALKAAKEGLKVKEPTKPEPPKPEPDQKKVPAVGTAFDVNGIRYKVTKSDAANGTVSAVKLTGKKKAKLVIPAEVSLDGYAFKVTAVAKNAFKKNKKVKTIVIGSNVKTIGKAAFQGCTRVKTVTFQTIKAPKIGKKALKGIRANAKVTAPKKIPAKQWKALKKNVRKAGAGNKIKYKKK